MIQDDQQTDGDQREISRMASLEEMPSPETERNQSKKLQKIPQKLDEVTIQNVKKLYSIQKKQGTVNPNVEKLNTIENKIQKKIDKLNFTKSAKRN